MFCVLYSIVMQKIQVFYDSPLMYIVACCFWVVLVKNWCSHLFRFWNSLAIYLYPYLSICLYITKACEEVFKIQNGPLNFNSEQVLYLLRCKICDNIPYVGKAKTKFRFRFDNYKSKHRYFRKEKQKVPQKRFHSHYISVKPTNNLKKERRFDYTN